MVVVVVVVCFSLMHRFPLVVCTSCVLMLTWRCRVAVDATADDHARFGNIWRRQQTDQRIVEIHACLDHLHQALAEQCPFILPPTLPSSQEQEQPHPLFQVNKDVLVLGHSFGGTAAIACAIRDQERGRFSHVFAYDSWLGGLSTYQTCPLSDQGKCISVACKHNQQHGDERETCM